MYRDLIKAGQSLYEIDEMDIHFFFELMNEEEEIEEVTADELGWL